MEDLSSSDMKTIADSLMNECGNISFGKVPPLLLSWDKTTLKQEELANN